MRRGTLPLSAVTTALMLLTAGCGLFGGGGNVFELAVGDCFDRNTDGGEISEVPIVECSEPHDSEVFHTFELSDDEFPGEDALLERAEEECVPAFEEYVGVDYAHSQLDIFPITPTEGSWSRGDREVVCALYDLDQGQLEGSMEGSVPVSEEDTEEDTEE